MLFELNVSYLKNNNYLNELKNYCAASRLKKVYSGQKMDQNWSDEPFLHGSHTAVGDILVPESQH